MLLIFLAGILAYANSFSAPFVYDDGYFILDPRTQRYFWPLWKAFIPPAHFQPVIHRPLVTLSLAINYALDGMNVWGYHVFNLGVHLLAALTLFEVLRRSGLARRMALAVALLWTVHPVQTEAVTFIYQRAEALMGLFYLLTLYGAIRSAEKPDSRGWKLFTVAVCAAGMLGKQGMITAPLLVLVYDRIFLSGSFARTLRLRGRMYAALFLTVLIPIFFFAIGHHENRSNFGLGMKEFTPLQFALNQPGVLLHYLRLAFWPYPLMLDRAWILAGAPRDLLPPLLAVAALLALTGWALIHRPRLGFLGLAFFLILSPVCSFMPVGDPGADHRFYLALAPVLTLAMIAARAAIRALLPGRPIRQTRISIALAACAVSTLTLVTVSRNHDYRSAVSLWSDNAAKCPRSFVAHSNLGTAYAQEGQYAPALEQFEIARRLQPNSPEAFANWGAGFSFLNHREQALACFKTAAELDPGNPEWHRRLGSFYLKYENFPGAEEEFSRTLRLESDFADVENALAVALTQQGRPEEALPHYARAIGLQPDYAKAYHNLAMTLMRLGKRPEAEQALQKAYRLDPKLLENDRKLVHDAGFKPGVTAAQ